jgi:hypothetical protein
MVDAINLPLGEHAENFAVKRFRGAQIGAERFFNDDSPPMPFRFADEACLSKPLHNARKCLRRCGKIEEIIPARAMGLVGMDSQLRQVLVGRRIMKLTLKVVEAGGDPVPRGVRCCASARPARSEAEFTAKRVIIHLVPGDADHGERFRQ